MKVKIILLVIIVVLLAVVSLGCEKTIDVVAFEGTVTDVKVSTGGFRSFSIATVYWDNGKVLNFKAEHTADFVIGQKYRIVAMKTDSQRSLEWWQIEELTPIS